MDSKDERWVQWVYIVFNYKIKVCNQWNEMIAMKTVAIWPPKSLQHFPNVLFSFCIKLNKYVNKMYDKLHGKFKIKRRPLISHLGNMAMNWVARL